MPHYEPKEPFDGYDVKEYGEMMDFILRVESIQAAGLGPWLMENLFNNEPGSVIDVGCGPGLYLVPFKEAGWTVYGIDGCPTGGSLLDKKEFKRWDLRFPFDPAKHILTKEPVLAPTGRFDMAICFEVAEHLEEHWADRLVDTLSDCAPIIVFSAATPGQGGTYHHNEQNHSYWLDKFKDRHGYTIHPKQEEFREFLAKWEPERARGEVSGWLIDNSFILAQETA